MKIKNFDYELLDSGNQYRLERFGSKIIARPEEIAIWGPQKPIETWKYDAIAQPQKSGKVAWNTKFNEPWIIDCGYFKMQLNLSETKNIGIFPEQFANWEFIYNSLNEYSYVSTLSREARDRSTRTEKRAVRPERSSEPIEERVEGYRFNVLNLFAYTGGATLAAAAAGAKVCHVDAAKSLVNVAKNNQILSGFQDAPIRWILDDCIKFVNREIKRGIKYDAIILDPPAFGKGKEGEIFKFEKDVPYLLELCKKLLKPDYKFLLLNCYSMGYSPNIIKNLLSGIFDKEKIEVGELSLPEKNRGYKLPCGIYGRVYSFSRSPRSRSLDRVEG